MVTIVTRSGKGSALTNAEIDTNFTNLNTGKVEDVTARATYLPSLVLDFANGKSLDPRVTFTRASTATYYDGVTVAKAEENLLLNSVHPLSLGWTLVDGYGEGTLGSERVVNGDFASSSGWSTEATWSVSGGVAVNSGSSGPWIYRNASITAGRVYRIQYDVVSVTTGSVRPFIAADQGAQIYGPSSSTTGAKTCYLISPAGSTFLVGFGTLSSFAGSVDNMSVVEVIANNVTAPDGTATAVAFTAAAANARSTQSISVAAGDHTFSVWLRRVTGTGDIQITTDSGAAGWVTQTITSSWARYTVTQTLTAGTRTPGVRITTAGDQVEVWGAQLEQRSSVTAYTPTTTAPITNYVPKLLTAAANTPRFQHDPITGESLGLMVEEQRTNLLLRSEEFNNGAWTNANLMVSANAAVAPDGSITGDKLVEDTASTAHYVAQGASVTIGAVYTYTVYIKAAERSFAQVRYENGSATQLYFVNVNLTDGTGSAFGTGGLTSTSFAIAPSGNGWWRVSLTVAANDASFRCLIYTQQSSGSNVYAGNGYSGVYVWGAQLEAGAFPTSYIPTAGSQVTRSADAASMTGTNFSSWFNQRESTVVVEAGSALGTFPQLFEFRLDNLNYLKLGKEVNPATDSNVLGLNSLFNNVAQLGLNSAVGSGRVAFAIAQDNTALSANGAAASTDTSCLFPAFNSMHIGWSQANGGRQCNTTIRRIAYYPERLPNADLQSLTA